MHRADRTPEKPPEPSLGEGFCPHCQLLVSRKAGEGWPDRALRCPHCRLLIGAGRGLAEPKAQPGARGSAAGVFVQDAKRDDGEKDAAVSAAQVLTAIREVATSLDTPPERLLMVDYQQQTAARPELPPLQAVFASYGSWKQARREAARTG